MRIKLNIDWIDKDCNQFKAGEEITVDPHYGAQLVAKKLATEIKTTKNKK